MSEKRNCYIIVKRNRDLGVDTVVKFNYVVLDIIPIRF